MDEETAKQTLGQWLQKKGWKTLTAGLGSQGVDIQATRDSHAPWWIEVKKAPSPSRGVTGFQEVLGQVLMRMGDEGRRYSIAFPEDKNIRKWWSKLPALAKKRTTISLLLINPDGSVCELD